MASLAGCGYRPGTGDARWQGSLHGKDFVQSEDVIISYYGSLVLDGQGSAISFHKPSDGEVYAEAFFDQNIETITGYGGRVYVLLHDFTLFAIEVPDPGEILSNTPSADLPRELDINSENTRTIDIEKGEDFGDPVVNVRDDALYLVWEGITSFDRSGSENWHISGTYTPEMYGVGDIGAAFWTNENQRSLTHVGADENRRWTTDIDFHADRIAVAGNYVFVVGKETVAIHSETGDRTSLSISGNTDLAFGPDRKSIYVVDSASETISKVAVDGPAVEWQFSGVTGTPAADSESVFAPTADGLVEIDAETGRQVWSETAFRAKPERVLWVGEESLVTVDSRDEVAFRHR